MSATLTRVQGLARGETIHLSIHARARLADWALRADEVTSGIGGATVVEDYPVYHKGPCVLVLQQDRRHPIHVLWGLPLGADRPASLITIYRPDPARWTPNFKKRLPKDGSAMPTLINHSTSPPQLGRQIREVLPRDWDPIGVGHTPECCNEYDRYIPRLYELIVLREPHRIYEYLLNIETGEMSLAATGDDRCQEVAQHLLDLLAPPPRES